MAAATGNDDRRQENPLCGMTVAASPGAVARVPLHRHQPQGQDLPLRKQTGCGGKVQGGFISDYTLHMHGPAAANTI